MCVCRGGGEDTTFEAKAKDYEKVRGQGQGLELPRTGCLEDTFENTRKCKCKHCNYDFTGIQA